MTVLHALPRLIIAAPMSGSGKTTITAGLIAACMARGIQVAPFKVGPDYIDPTYHALAAGRPCANLDAWLLPSSCIGATLYRRSEGADLALIEGVMGLFDGYSGNDDSGSTAHIARLTQTPVLLILDARAMARTAAALVQGLCDFDPQVQIAGVLLNRVGSARHAALITTAIESTIKTPVVGYLQRDDELALPERHLGLIPTTEPGRWQAWLDLAHERLSATVDLDHIVALAQHAAPFPVEDTSLAAMRPDPQLRHDQAPLIAVARDAAFSFLYEDNLDLLRAAGAELIFFSPLHDQTLPSGVQALYLCGGFPELYATELAANSSLRALIHRLATAGMPIYAECGGLMYLTEAVVDIHGTAHPMVGVLPGRSLMTQRLTLGYRTVCSLDDNWLWRVGESTRGHEFHYSQWYNDHAPLTQLYERLPDSFHSDAQAEGARVVNVIASYIHIHFLAYPELATRFTTAARAWVNPSRTA